MEINSGHSNVQIAIAVQPQNKPARGQEVEFVSDSNGGVFSASVPTALPPSINTSGQEVGNLINTWA